MKIKWKFLLPGIYAWITAVFFGSILMDVLYARLLAHFTDTSAITTIFSDVSDMLLRLGFILILSALAAIISCWNCTRARNYLIASLFIFSFEFSLPIIFPYLKTSLGPFWIRLFVIGTASILAFIGQQNRYLKE